MHLIRDRQPTALDGFAHPAETAELLWVLIFIGYYYLHGYYMYILFRNSIATGLIGTYIHRVLVIDGYTYTPQYMVSEVCEYHIKLCIVSVSM